MDLHRAVFTWAQVGQVWRAGVSSSAELWTRRWGRRQHRLPDGGTKRDWVSANVHRLTDNHHQQLLLARRTVSHVLNCNTCGLQLFEMSHRKLNLCLVKADGVRMSCMLIKHDQNMKIYHCPVSPLCRMTISFHWHWHFHFGNDLQFVVLQTGALLSRV